MDLITCFIIHQMSFHVSFCQERLVGIVNSPAKSEDEFNGLQCHFSGQSPYRGVVLVLNHDDRIDVPMYWVQHVLNVVT